MSAAATRGRSRAVGRAPLVTAALLVTAAPLTAALLVTTAMVALATPRAHADSGSGDDARAEPARAIPAVALEVAGSCPSFAQLRAALSRVADVVTGADPGAWPGAWTVRVVGSRRGARIEVRDPGGRVSLVRSVDSADCLAVAAACAVILHAHIRARGGAVSAVAAPVALAPSLRAAATPGPWSSSPSRPGGASDAARNDLDARADRDDPAGGLAAARERRDRADRRDLRGWALGGGFGAGAAPGGLAPLLWVSSTWAPRAGGLLMRGSLSVTPAARLAASSETPEASAVDRRALGLVVDAGYRIPVDRGFWLLAGGVGVEASRVDVAGRPDLARVVRAHPILRAAAAGGVQVRGRLWVTAELSASLYPLADRYLDANDDEIARSPRASLELTAGIAWRLGSPGAGD